MSFKIKKLEDTNGSGNFHKNGYLNINKLINFENYFLKDWVTKCFNLVDNFTLDKDIDLQDSLIKLGDAYTDKKKWNKFKEVYVGIFQRNLDIYKITTNPNILKILKSIGLKTPYMCSDPLLMLNGGAFSKILGELTDSPLHQDWASMQSSANSVVLWIPLVDVEKKTTGSIKVWPGTHKKGLFDVESGRWFAKINCDNKNLRQDTAKEIIAKSGDCIMFSSLLVHQSISSKFGKKLPRLTLQLRYGDLSCRLLNKNNGVFNYNHCAPIKKPYEREELIVPEEGWDQS